ncbi:SAM-dependent methyltransferase [Kineosporia sp. J2-2]|uniref:SAM-dependent methyltransferase n=1 Tax=Kineosporia corallincola TaxID=2835133 RepID=A0ABS5TE34_9ACTN|nr:SAM-dependent methyltransferase [Kineosporia corallincola]MBT0769336.1 SAM-dependent methyltransferase [Kineosporia corallincola]
MTTQPHDPQADSIEVDWSWTDSDEDWIPPEIDTSRPSAARMYDYAIGGKDNYEVDRRAVHEVGQILPDFQACAHANRGFLVRAVEALATLGVDQFIDLGSGIPTSPNVHEVAQKAQPSAKVVYVDNDPIVMTYNRALREPQPGVLSLDHDMRRPHAILDDPRLRAHLDLDRPVALLLVAVLHFVRREMAVKVVEQYARLLPAGSYIAISVVCSDGMQPALVERLEQVYEASATPFVARTGAQVEQLFDGKQLIEPGLTDVTRWRSDQGPLPIRILGGVARIG